MKTPVLLLVFNRPELTAQCFAAIRAARPERLYVAADGPRAARLGEAGRCAAVRRIATAVDWPCELKTLFRQDNLGCGRAVAEGITWFFENEAEGIILEDDIDPDPSFFLYCEALLERYRDDEQVAMISGYNRFGSLPKSEASYGFTQHACIWGWASWRRAWQQYDFKMASWPSPAARHRVAAVLGKRRFAIQYWSDLFDQTKSGTIDTWDYQWVFSMWMNEMIGILPATALIANIGFGDDATHTFAPVAPLPPRGLMSLPLKHPQNRYTMRLDRAVETQGLW